MKIFRSFLVILSLLLLCGCNSLADLDGGYEAHFVGLMVQIGDDYAALEDIYPGENYLDLYEDGTGVIAFSGFEENLTWSNQGATYTFVFQNEASVGTLKDGILEVEIEGNVVTYVAEGAICPVIPTTAPPDYDSDLTVPYGTYQGLTISYEGEMLPMSEFYKGECSIQLDVNGMGTLMLGGGKLRIAWDLSDGVLTIADENGVNSVGLLSDGVIVLDYMESGIQLAFSKEGIEP